MKFALIEYERRFLFRHLPEGIDPATGYTRIIDRYIVGTQLRLRRMEDPDGQVTALKFAKKFHAPEHPFEQTVITTLYIDQEEYDRLHILEARVLTKKRYHFESQGLRYSIDVFEGALQPLILGEFDTIGPAELAAAPLPEGCIGEVTADPFFTGGNLVRISNGELRNYLSGKFV